MCHLINICGVILGHNFPRVTGRTAGQYLLLIVLFGRSVTVAQELPNLLVGVRFPPSEPFLLYESVSMNNEKFYNFNNFGYILIDLSNDDLKEIKEEVEEIKQDFSLATPLNSYLAGNIKHEFNLIKSLPKIECLLLQSYHMYNCAYNISELFNSNSKDCPLKLSQAWVNFQKKHEFNPTHTHSGVLSFVIWLNIPYLMNDELKNPSTINSTVKCPGHFSFTYCTTLGNIFEETIPVDKSWENKMIVFPSKMNHSVYPFFTSDDFRISVSGNLIFEV